MNNILLSNLQFRRDVELVYQAIEALGKGEHTRTKVVLYLRNQGIELIMPTAAPFNFLAFSKRVMAWRRPAIQQDGLGPPLRWVYQAVNL